MNETELIQQWKQEVKRFKKADDMFQNGDQEFHDKHYKDFCKVLGNITKIERELRKLGINPREIKLK